MSKRYTDEERNTALRRLILNDGAVGLTSVQTGVPRRTLVRWWREHRAAPPAPQSERPEPLRPERPQSADRLPDEAALQRLRRQLLANAAYLADSLADGAEDATLSQRATALSQVLATVIKLSAILGQPEQEQIVRIEYQDPDGSLHQSPPWTRRGVAASGEVQSGSVRPPLGQDGDG